MSALICATVSIKYMNLPSVFLEKQNKAVNNYVVLIMINLNEFTLGLQWIWFKIYRLTALIIPSVGCNCLKDREFSMNEARWNANTCAVFLQWADSSSSLLENDRLEFLSLLDVFCQNVQLLLQLNSCPLHDGLVTLTTKPKSHPEDSLLRALNK